MDLAVFEKSWRVLARGTNGRRALKPPPRPQISVIRCSLHFSRGASGNGHSIRCAFQKLIQSKSSKCFPAFAFAPEQVLALASMDFLQLSLGSAKVLSYVVAGDFALPALDNPCQLTLCSLGQNAEEWIFQGKEKLKRSGVTLARRPADKLTVDSR